MPVETKSMSPLRISSGIESLDSLADLHRGDNVVWEVDAGTSYEVFIRNFIARSFQDAQSVIYVSFNRSPQTILNELDSTLLPEHFTLIDCFTSGKGKNDNTFLRFYDKPSPVQTVRIENPRNIDLFTETLNAIEDRHPPGARYVFDSLTGMQDLWGDESDTHRFFTYMCPRLFDLGTVAYWILEKDAHSQKFKANLRHITQVVFDLYRRKNALYIKALKLEGRQEREGFKPHLYEISGKNVTVTLPKKEQATADVGTKIRESRTRRGLSQKELADRVGLTPSFLSQLESNQVSPSLNTFLLICRVLEIDPGRFLGQERTTSAPWLFRGESIRSAVVSREEGYRTAPVLNGEKLSALLVTVEPGAVINRHFFYHKREEFVYVISGAISVTMEGRTERLRPGDAIHIRESFPSQWKNEGGDEVQLLVIW